MQIYTSKFLPQSVPPTMISIWDFFFQMMISLPSYDDFLMISRLLKDSFNFGEATSSHFRVTTSIKQLLFQGSYFFRTDFLFGDAHFSEQSFFISVIFQSETSTEQPILRIESSLGQLLYVTATFLEEELFRIKISTEGLLFWSRYCYTISTFSEKLHFGKR